MNGIYLNYMFKLDMEFELFKLMQNKMREDECHILKFMMIQYVVDDFVNVI